MSPTQRASLHNSPAAMTALWDDLSGECIRHQQRECLELLHKCEESHQVLLTASMGGASGTLRRSRDYDTGTAHDAGMLRLSMEKENRVPEGSAMIGSVDAMSVLQMLQFEGTEPFEGPFPHSDSGKGNSRDSRHAWEVQITYCGLGPHYHLPVRDVLLFEEAKRVSAHGEHMRATEAAHQEREHQAQTQRTALMLRQTRQRHSDPDNSRWEGTCVEGDEGGGAAREVDVRQKYMQVLKSSLKSASVSAASKGTNLRQHALGRKVAMGDKGGRVTGSGSGKARGVVIKSAVVKKSLDGTADTVTGSRDSERDAGDADEGNEVAPPPPPPANRHHVHFSPGDGVDSVGSGYHSEGYGERDDGLSETRDNIGHPQDMEAHGVGNEADAVPTSADTQLEDDLLRALFSEEVTKFLAAAGDQVLTPSCEWAEGLFSNDSLGIPSEILFAALSTAQSEDDAVELPSSIVGSPPLPWTCPDTAVTAAPSMRLLTKLFENSLDDANRIYRHSRTLWSARLNLLRHTQRVAQQLSVDAATGADELRRLSDTVMCEREAIDQARGLLRPATALEERIEVRIIFISTCFNCLEHHVIR